MALLIEILSAFLWYWARLAAFKLYGAALLLIFDVLFWLGFRDLEWCVALLEEHSFRWDKMQDREEQRLRRLTGHL